MKRITAIVLTAVLMTGLLSGCSKKTEDPGNAAAASGQEEMTDTDAPAETAEPDEETEAPSLEETQTEEVPAEEEIAEEEMIPEELPEFYYTGDDPYIQTIWEYMKDTAGTYYAPADVAIPDFQILREDDSDPDDIKVWGNFWLYNYNFRGATLMLQSGGEYPGLVHLKASGDGFEVTGMDQVEDGDHYDVSVRKIFGVDNELLEAFRNLQSTARESRTSYIRMYAEESGLPILAYQDFGWDPVSCSDEEIFPEYPDIAGEWTNEDGTVLMSIHDPVGGSTYDVTIHQVKEDGSELIYELFGQHEMSTGSLYYWDGWIRDENDEDRGYSTGVLALREDNSILWTREEDGESIAFVRASSEKQTADVQDSSAAAPSMTHAFSNTFTPSINEEQAKAAALENAGLQEQDVVFVRTELELDDGKWQYEVEFYSGNLEYDYDIDAESGAIISFDQDAEYYVPEVKPAVAAGSITDQEALETALSHAGVTQNEISRAKIKKDFDDGRWVYEIEFRVGWQEYEYDIDAETGNILGYDIGD